MRWLWMLMACACSLVSPAAAGASAAAPLVRIISNDFVAAGKFRQLQAFADTAGVRLEHVDVEHAAGGPEDWLAAADLLLLDVPRPVDRAQVEAALGEDWQASAGRWLSVGGGPPQAGGGLSAAQSRMLAGYYAAGGERNFGQFFRYAAALLSGRPLDGFGPPEPRLAQGFYHPVAPGLFASLDDYLAWGQPRWRQSNGTVAFLVPAGMVGDLQTAAIDTLVAKAEAARLTPVVFWFDEAGSNLTAVLGQGRIDALVNLGHLQDGKRRSEDFLALDIPVLQTTTFRQEPGGPDWQQADTGIAPRTLAVFLAGPEGWGMSDPLVLREAVRGEQGLLPEQADALIGKLRSLVALRRVPPAEKKLALMFWNYPLGEKNLAASHLNLPRSIAMLSSRLAEAGYEVTPMAENELIESAQAMLGGLYRSVSLDDLEARGLAVAYPVARYRQWLARLPAHRRQALAHWGDPARHWAVRERPGGSVFLIPLLQLGNLTVMPQMPRGAEPGQHYHDTDSAPDHLYLAAYLYLRETLGAHALIHMGTHGTQEWLPGKDRGLAASDFPFLALGDMPVFYPYLQDNVGEAMQARRRGRAVIISHQTPPFAPAGLYDTLTELHQLIHEYQQLDAGPAQAAARERLLAAALAAHLHEDMAWSPEDARARFPEFFQALHDHLHELARVAMPLGLHTFGQPAAPEHRLMTIMQQLGQPFYDALGAGDDEWQTGDTTALMNTVPYRFLQQHLRDGDEQAAKAVPPAEVAAATPAIRSAGDLSPELQGWVQRARELDAGLTDTQEIESLLAGLAGRFVRPGAGGDPLRNPDIASGRNLYAFEADKIPAPAAYEAGREAFAQLVQAHAAQHDGEFPRKLAFSLWSSEAIRHLGVTEAQVLHALGLRPVWGRGGRVERLDIVPTAELGRPRVDVVVHVTGVYRDQFDGFMRLLAEAIERLSELDEPGNVVAAGTRQVEQNLLASGMAPEQAARAARWRIFGNAMGSYGTGVPDLALRADDWQENGDLARRFIDSSAQAFGTDVWGGTVPDGPLAAGLGQHGARANTQVFEAQLRDVQAVVMSRSSSLHGVLSTDHPFEFMGGLSAAVTLAGGQAPGLYVSDLRQAAPRVASLQGFLSEEMRARYLNPAWIKSMQAEGYAGAVNVLAVTNNLYGWQVLDPSTVRDDQWQSMFDTYVADTRELGINEWFEASHPEAQAQMLERMAETIRRGHWDAPEATRKQLAERWQQLQQAHGVKAGAAVTQRYMDELVAGYGLAEAGTSSAAQSQASAAPDVDFDAPANPGEPAPESELQPVSGQELRPVSETTPPGLAPWLPLVLLAWVVFGGWTQIRENRRLRGTQGVQ